MNDKKPYPETRKKIDYPTINNKGDPDYKRNEKGQFTSQGKSVGRKLGATNEYSKEIKEIILETGPDFLRALFKVAMNDLKTGKVATNAVKVCSAFLLKQMPTFKAVLIEDATKEGSMFRQWATWTTEQKNQFFITGGEEIPETAELAAFEVLNEPIEEEDEESST